MSETLFRKTVRTAGANQGLGCLGAAALIPLVVVIMNVVLLAMDQAMSDSLESFVQVSIPVGLVLAVGFGIAAYRFAKRSARELELRRVDGRLLLTITPDIELEGPFEVTVGWDRIQKGIKLLWCDVARDGELMCRLSREIGSIHAPPAGWRRLVPPADQPATHGGYSVGGVEELAKLLRDES